MGRWCRAHRWTTRSTNRQRVAFARQAVFGWLATPDPSIKTRPGSRGDPSDYAPPIPVRARELDVAVRHS